jgi:hypothetical protein
MCATRKPGGRVRRRWLFGTASGRAAAVRSDRWTGRTESGGLRAWMRRRAAAFDRWSSVGGCDHREAIRSRVPGRREALAMTAVAGDNW